jgi:hypothetical protein
MMKKILLGIAIVSSIAISSCDELINLDELNGEKIILGLKDALVHGTDTAVANLSAPDGFFRDQAVKILLPEYAQPIYNVLNTLPLVSDLLDETILAINRSAEDAATEAKPIFLDAIREITIEDGLTILNGPDTAATAYLKGKTYTQLFDAFKPKIETSLSKEIVLGISAEASYAKLIDTYNAIPFVSDIQSNSLSEHTTNRALKGIFKKVGDEEKLIREDPAHRVTDILEEVFGSEY